jgi:hypothetical protein
VATWGLVESLPARYVPLSAVLSFLYLFLFIIIFFSDVFCTSSIISIAVSQRKNEYPIAALAGDVLSTFIFLRQY